MQAQKNLALPGKDLGFYNFVISFLIEHKTVQPLVKSFMLKKACVEVTLLSKDAPPYLSLQLCKSLGYLENKNAKIEAELVILAPYPGNRSSKNYDVLTLHPKPQKCLHFQSCEILVNDSALFTFSPSKLYHKK